MIGHVSLKYAVRSLLRNPRRTILSIIGVGIGSGIAVFAMSWIGGAREMEIRAVAESGCGHLRIVPADWPDRRENTLRLENPTKAIAAVDALAGVRAYGVRARVNGLLAMGNRTAGVEIAGVVPELEAGASRIVQKATIEGRYLTREDTDAVVIGRTLAKRLGVEVDDSLFVTLVGRDEIQSAMLNVVGILETGSRDVDAMVCHVTLDELERVSGFPGPAEISILLDDYRRVDAGWAALAEAVPQGDAVITWKEVNPAFAASIEGDAGFGRLLIGIIVIVVALGIASAQLTVVLERRTELAILSALGMKGRQVVILLAIESFVIGLAGGVTGMLLGGAGAYYLATIGIDIEAIMGDEVAVGDIMLDPHVYGAFGWWIVWFAFGISVVATLAASLYPARMATRIEPARALRK
ncbi:MAG TPA: FtsX-like permease family protein [Candidatus Hydrogenedentes bacterium]|nr:FtsX-like permease family protein [Candidatus Hydrogenedentota bacterium]HPG69353.1 FtsX-like permease family protein [Candidatus Hydrogenedentota bacterium]